jgi:hypothetical protein
MMSYRDQAEFFSSTHTAEGLEAALDTLKADHSTGVIELKAITVLEEALRLRRVYDRVREALEGVPTTNEE